MNQDKLYLLPIPTFRFKPIPKAIIRNFDKRVEVGPLFWPVIDLLAGSPIDGLSAEQFLGIPQTSLNARSTSLSVGEIGALCTF